MSHVGSLIRCSSSIAQPSVTALSPRRRSSTASSARVFAKCSVWPASWKRARQSSGPPIGWITSITFPGTSTGEQNARGLLFGRCSTSRCTFSCARRSMPRPWSVPSSAGSIRSAGKTGSHFVARKTRADVPAAGLFEPDADALAEHPVGRVLVERLGRVEEGAALTRQVVEPVAELVVELAVARDAEVAPRRRVRLLVRREQDRVQVLLGELVPHPLDALAPVAVVAVRDRRPQHPERDVLAVDRRRQLGLDVRRILLVLPRQRAEVAVAGEAPQLDRAEAAVDGLTHPLRLLERGHVLVPRVDRLEVEIVLQAREVLVVLLVDLRDEAIDPLAVGVEVARGRGGHTA